MFCLLPLLAVLWGAATQAQETAATMLAKSEFHGGLIVLVGSRDATMATAMAKEPNALVHVLATDREALPGLRGSLREAGLYGRVSAMAWEGRWLPYGDGMVNLLIVADQDAKLAPGEVDRVLAPRGTVWTWRNGAMVSRRESVPDDVDEWSHSRYDATGNAVSKDKQVGPPKYLQWEAWPRWNHGTKTSCLVSAQGRIFFILDDAHFATNKRTSFGGTNWPVGRARAAARRSARPKSTGDWWPSATASTPPWARKPRSACWTRRPARSCGCWR
jgi:hypothetical protein